MRFRCDRSYERHGLIILGGSPLKIMRVTPAALPLITDLESGADLHPTQGQMALLHRCKAAGMIHPVPDPLLDPMPGRPLRVRRPISIITPVHRHDPTGQALDPVTVAEALVIDDGSTPPLHGARIRLEHNAGPAAARNAGLALIPVEDHNQEYVIFLDADVDPGPDPDWYLPLLALCERDPQLAVVAPRVASRPGPSRRERYESAHSPLDLGPQPARVQPRTRVSYVPSTALLCRVAALREVGGFTQEMRFGEDVDLIWRLIAAGWTCRYHPDVVVHHPPRSNWAAWCRQRVGYGSSAAALGIRHGDKVAPAHLHPISSTTWALAVTGHLTLAAATVAGSAVALSRRVGPGLPRDVAARIALRGSWSSGLGLARAVRRVWWPLLVPIALWSRRVRGILLVCLLAAGPPRITTAIAICDDLCYSAGVWTGVGKGIRLQRERRALWALFPTTSRATRDATVRS